MTNQCERKPLAVEITDVVATLFTKACLTTITGWKVTERRCKNGDAILDVLRYCMLQNTPNYQWSFQCGGATSAPRRWTDVEYDPIYAHMDVSDSDHEYSTSSEEETKTEGGR